MKSTKEKSAPECGEDGCTRQSRYLMPRGDLCTEHMAEHYPEDLRYLRATLGTPEVQ